MFKVKDYVVYGLTGVCQIIDISSEFIDNDETEYYVLHPVYNNNHNMTIKIPVNNTKVSMRKIITKKDISSLIAMMPEMETIWIEDMRQRKNDYMTALRTGNSEECMKIIKTLYLEKQAKSAEGKTLTKTDENIMNTAEKQLYEEFAVALDISPDEVMSYIFEHIS